MRDALHQEIASLRRDNELLTEQVAHLRSQIDELRRLPDTRFPAEWHLTPTPSRILSCLLAAPDGFRTREAIHFVSMRGMRDTQVKTIDVSICKIRKVLPPRSIECVYGQGYRLTALGRQYVLDVLHRKQTNGS